MFCRQNTFLGRSICRRSIGPYFHEICQRHKLCTRFALCLPATFLLRNLGIGRLPEYWNLGIDRCRNFGRRMLCRQNTFLGRSICRCSIGPYFHGICQRHKLGTRFALCLAATFLLRNLYKTTRRQNSGLEISRSGMWRKMW